MTAGSVTFYYDNGEDKLFFLWFTKRKEVNKIEEKE